MVSQVPAGLHDKEAEANEHFLMTGTAGGLGRLLACILHCHPYWVVLWPPFCNPQWKFSTLWVAMWRQGKEGLRSYIIGKVGETSEGGPRRDRIQKCHGGRKSEQMVTNRNSLRESLAVLEKERHWWIGDEYGIWKLSEKGPVSRHSHVGVPASTYQFWREDIQSVTLELKFYFYALSCNIWAMLSSSILFKEIQSRALMISLIVWTLHSCFSMGNRQFHSDAKIKRINNIIPVWAIKYWNK